MGGCGRAGFGAGRRLDAGSADSTQALDASNATFDGAQGLDVSDAGAQIDVAIVAEASDAPLSDAAALDVAVDAETASVQITAPTAGPRLMSRVRTTTFSGTCSPNITALTVTFPSGEGRALSTELDCSDGIWSVVIEAYVHNFAGATFLVSGRTASGVSASDSVMWDYTPVIEIIFPSPPGRPTSGSTRASSVAIRGVCVRDAIITDAGPGALADSSCADGYWSMTSVSLPTTGTTSFFVTAMDAAGEMVTDTFDVVSDRTPPSDPALVTLPSAMGDDNFPLIDVTLAAGASRHMLFADSACRDPIAPVSRGVGTSARFRFYVPDNTTREIYAQAADDPGNVSACVRMGSYQEVTPNLIPTECDYRVDADTTPAALQLELDRMNSERATYLADGHLTLCLASGVTVRSVSAADGDQVRFVGDRWYVKGEGSGALRPVIHAQRPDSVSAIEITGYNFTLDNVRVSVDRAFTPPIRVSGAIRLITDSDLRSTAGAPQSGIITSIGTSAQIIGEIRNTNFVSAADSAGAWGLSVSGFIGRMDRVTINAGGWRGITMSPNGLNNFPILGELIDSELRFTGSVDSAWQPFLLTGRVSRMERVRFVCAKSPSTPCYLGFIESSTDSAVTFGIPAFFDTARIVDNTFCNAGGTWVFAAISPTTPNTGDPSGPQGARTFPWGDADDVSNAPWNLQRQWGGACP